MLTTLDGQPYATYDANGNTLTGGGRTNVWDSQNRLRQCVYNSVTSAFTYGSDGLRRSMTVGTQPTVCYVLNGQSVVREGHLDNGDFVPDATYLQSECRVDESSDNAGWYVHDGLGSVVAEVGEADQNNNPVKCTRKLDVYGSIRGETGTATSKHKFVGQLSHTTEPDTGGLIYMRARWYDPWTGRFVSEDPGYHGDNWYVYCENNPANLIDKDGKIAGPIVVVAVGASVGLGLYFGFADGWNTFVDRFVGSSDPDFARIGFSLGTAGGAAAGGAATSRWFGGAMYGRGAGLVPFLRAIGRASFGSYALAFALGTYAAELDFTLKWAFE